MPVGYLVSGPYSREHNLRTVIEARCETVGNFLVGVATDEYDTNLQINSLEKSLEFALETNHTAPQNFWGVGGMKILSKMGNKMNEGMLAPYKKMFDEMDKK